MSASIHLRQARLGYGRSPVLAVDALDLAPGELVAVLGSNGSGKSTLLAALAGLLAPLAGSVTLAEKEVRRIPPRQRARLVGLLPQSPPRPEHLRVRDLVLLGRYARLGWLGSYAPEDEAAADQALADCEIAHLAQRPVANLSGGEYQRVCLARLLAQDPEVLLLDEPEAALDPAHALAAGLLLRRAARRGRLVVMAMHQINLAALLCDRLVLLAPDKDIHTVRADGPPETVITRENLRDVYHSETLVIAHPHGGRPQVLHVLPHDPGSADPGPAGSDADPRGPGEYD